MCSSPTARSPPTHAYHLAAATPEAKQLKEMYGERARLVPHCRLQDLDRHLEGCTAWYFIGHGDFSLNKELVPIFGGDRSGEALQSISPEAICQVLTRHVERGLRLVVLNGCKTLKLGQGISQMGVPHVLCWSTAVADEAASCISISFARGVAEEVLSTEQAFNRAKSELLVQTHRRSEATAVEVQKWQIADPDEDRNLGYRYAAGKVELLCAEQRTEVICQDRQTLLEALYSAGKQMRDQGDLSDAVILHRMALRQPTDPVMQAKFLKGLGKTLRQQASLVGETEREQLLKSSHKELHLALVTEEELYAEQRVVSKTTSAQTQRELCLVLRDLGRHEDAMVELEAVRSIHEEGKDQHPVELAITLTTMATVRKQQAMAREALVLDQHPVELAITLSSMRSIHKEGRDQHRVELAITLTSMATVRMQQAVAREKLLLEAVNWLDQALDIVERELGDTADEVGIALRNRGECKQMLSQLFETRRDQLPEARRDLERACEIFKQKGSPHWNHARVRYQEVDDAMMRRERERGVAENGVAGAAEAAEAAGAAEAAEAVEAVEAVEAAEAAEAVEAVKAAEGPQDSGEQDGAPPAGAWLLVAAALVGASVTLAAVMLLRRR